MQVRALAEQPAETPRRALMPSLRPPTSASPNLESQLPFCREAPVVSYKMSRGCGYSATSQLTRRFVSACLASINGFSLVSMGSSKYMEKSG